VTSLTRRVIVHLTHQRPSTLLPHFSSLTLRVMNDTPDSANPRPLTHSSIHLAVGQPSPNNVLAVQVHFCHTLVHLVHLDLDKHNSVQVGSNSCKIAFYLKNPQPTYQNSVNILTHIHPKSPVLQNLTRTTIDWHAVTISPECLVEWQNA